jgi:hypothetical protein
MEMFYSKMKGKKVVVISEMACLSPWILAHADAVLEKIDLLKESLEQFIH